MLTLIARQRSAVVAHTWHTRAEMCHTRRRPLATFAQLRRHFRVAATGVLSSFDPLVVGSSPAGPSTPLSAVQTACTSDWWRSSLASPGEVHEVRVAVLAPTVWDVCASMRD